MKENKFDLMAMAEAYDEEEEADLFKQAEPEKPVQPVEDVPAAPKRKPWTPDAELLEGMDEMNTTGPVTYSKDEWKEEADGKVLGQVADDEAINEARKSMDALERANLNIEDAKARHNIAYMTIPNEAGDAPGQYHALLTAAAQDDDYRRSQDALDKLINEISTAHPEWFVYNDQLKDKEDPNQEDTSGDVSEDNGKPVQTEKKDTSDKDDDSSDVKVVIDKRNVSSIAWSPEETAKLRKARTIEVDIVEGSKLEFGEIYSMNSTMVDKVLEQYHSKVNSIDAALPASKYRCTFVGLSYPEVLELSNSNQMNNLEGEWEKWSICFNHIRNQSIGPWEEWDWYIDPRTGERVEVHNGGKVPDYIDPDTVTHVTKFHDFMMKTSYKDLNFMLWKILCATSMDQELVPIVCKAVDGIGRECGHNYDWVYRPSEMLDVKSILPSILEDMKEAGEASSWDEVIKAYNSSPLNSNNTMQLKSSGFRVISGHISAYEYLTHDWPIVNRTKDEISSSPTAAAESITDNMMPAIRAILINDGNGRWGRVTNRDDIQRILRTLDEFDWQTLAKVSSMMLDPYDFRFALDGITCPKCKHKSTIQIRDMRRMLFIVAQSLSSVQVELRQS